MSNTAQPEPGPAHRESIRGGQGRLGRISRSVSAKLMVLLLASLIYVFFVLGYLNITQHRHDLEADTLVAAERASDVIKRSAQYHMLRNDREALYTMIQTVGHEPGIERIRIINQEGRVSYSTEPAEVGRLIDKSAEACYGCHAQEQPLVRLDRPDRFRIYQPNGYRVLGIINPIENQPSCSNAACHFHPPEQKILGVLDTNLSLKHADAGVKQGSLRMLAYTALAVVIISLLCGLFVWRLVHIPVKKLKSGTDRLARGDLGYQIDFFSTDELGELATSFNRMSREVADAREEVTAWARTLEQRVEEKSRELKLATDQMLQVEKMASIGKLAATVAHEINNPLAGILTYSKLLKKWLERGDWTDERRSDARSSLDLIESESRRCGDIVRNLLTFSRTTSLNPAWTDLNQIVQRCLMLVQHRADLGNIAVHPELSPALPAIYCDAAQIEQLVLALVINAVEAMPRGGNLGLRTSPAPGGGEIILQVQDDGVGIPAEIAPHLFEPFFTTKEGSKGSHGVGLGLAISKNIVERHLGRIDLKSEPGRGTTFTITLPVDGRSAQPPDRNAAAPAAQPLLSKR